MLIHREPWKYSGRTPEFFTGQAGCYCCGTAAIGNYHVFFGNKAGAIALATGYKWSSSAWSAITSAATASDSRAIGYMENGVAYHSYGVDASASRDSQKYESTPDSWTALTAGPTPARVTPVAFMITDAFVCGGRDFSLVVLSDNDSYSPSNDSWTAKTDISAPARYEAHAFQLNGYGFVCGGINAAFQRITDNERYDSQGDSWSAKANIPVARSSAGFFNIGNDGFLLSGREGTIVADSDYYTESTDAWTGTTNVPSPSRAQMASAAVSVISAGYITTGFDSGGIRTKDHDEYTSGTWTSQTDISGDARGYATGASC